MSKPAQILWHPRFGLAGKSAAAPLGAALCAERERRGLLVLHRQTGSWRCTGGCVLLSEGGRELPPPALGDQPLPKGFTALAYFNKSLDELTLAEAALLAALPQAPSRLNPARNRAGARHRSHFQAFFVVRSAP